MNVKVQVHATSHQLTMVNPTWLLLCHDTGNVVPCCHSRPRVRALISGFHRRAGPSMRVRVPMETPLLLAPSLAPSGIYAMKRFVVGISGYVLMWDGLCGTASASQ